MPNEGAVVVYQAGDSVHAHLVGQWLAGQGIEAQVEDTPLENIRGRVPSQLVNASLWVKSGDAPRARQLLKEFDARRGAATEVVAPFCYHCGALLDSQLARCPECRHELDWS